MRDKSFFAKIFISLIAIEFILLSGILIIQGYVVSKASMSELSKSSADKIDVIKNYSEITLKDIEKTALYIALNDNVSVLDGIAAENITKTDNVFALYNLMDFLKLQASVDSSISSIYIYSKDMDIVVSSSGDICALENFYDKAWVEYCDDDMTFRWTGKRAITHVWEIPDVITLIYPFKNFNTSGNYAVIINVSPDALNDILISNYGEEKSSACFILDDSMQLIARSLYGSDDMLAQAIEIDCGKSVLKDSILYTCGVSDYNGWKYVNAVSVSFPNSRSKSIVVGMLSAGVCMLVAGVMLSYFISRRFAQPVEKLISKINGRGNGNEFEIINEVFDAMLKKEKYIQAVLGDGEEDIKSDYLRRCISGEICEPDAAVLMDGASADSYALVIVSIGNYTRFAARFTAEELLRVQNMIRLAGEKIFCESGGAAGTNTGENVYVWLVGIKNVDGNKLREQAEVLKHEIEGVADEGVALIISEEFSAINETDSLYRMSMEQRAEFIMYNKGGTLACGEDHQPQQRSYEYPTALERQIISCIDTNDMKNYAESITEFFSKIRAEKLSCDMVRITVNQLLGAMLAYISADSVNVMEVFGENIYTILADLETLDEIELFIYNTGIRIISYRKNNSGGDDSYYISKILEFINLNYHNDISVSDVAQSVGLSYSHVRKIFFEKMHTNILSYINGIRIEEAKKLLSTTGRTVFDIAKEIGYNNEQSFSRYFKKSTGITPGEYRRRKQNENQEDLM